MVPMELGFVAACAVYFRAGVDEGIGAEQESLIISILSLLHRAQVDFPKVLTTEIVLPCHRIWHSMRSLCIPGVGVAAPGSQMLAKCLA